MTTLPQTMTRSPRLPANGMSLPNAGLNGAAQPPVSSTMNAADVMRVMRANIWLIGIVLALSAILGYLLNSWLAAKHSKYTSNGLINVKNEKINPLDGALAGGTSPAELEIEQMTHAKLLTHDRLHSSVLETSDPVRETEWFKQFVIYKNGASVLDAEAAKADLQEHFEVKVVPNSRLIQVSMSWSVPKDCQTIVQQLVDQYIKNVHDQDTLKDIEQAHALESLKQNYESQIREISANASHRHGPGKRGRRHRAGRQQQGI